jgi:hypothetical protein
MRQHEKYQTICDYAPTISHDMSVTHDIKRCETPMQKLQEIMIAFGRLSKITALTSVGAVFLRSAVQSKKNRTALFTFSRFYGIINEL